MIVKYNCSGNFGMKNSLKILLAGYNGANNTGSEARLLSIIEDIKVNVDSRALITVPMLNEGELERLF